ncbi:Zinc metalloproteinase nas-8 [Aphelenchoides bicaudatus]|nr:Zinc metalloproteinase nas-8 [Aphelenchoides bicaudatus]
MSLCCSNGFILVLMLLLAVQSCHATLEPFQQRQPFLTDQDFERSKNDEATTFLSDEDFDNAKKYNDLLLVKKPKRAYILSHQKYYRGDIKGRAESKLNGFRKSGVRRNGVINTIKKWPQARIPYVLSTQYNERERAVLARAIQEYHRQTCIRFTPKLEGERDYLYIGKIDGCFSDVGRAGGRQLSLDDGCLQYDTVIHELLHSVGFYHEHERDHYINILWQNIDKEAYDQFGRVDLTESSYYGQPYDYKSIMHYDSLAFSKNGRETLVAKQPQMTQVIGSALDFSPTDLIKIRQMYYCPAQPDSSLTSANHITQQALNYGTPRVETPWSTSNIQSGLPISNHIIEQPPPMPIIALPRAREETTTVESNIPCADRSTLCYRWLDRCRSPFFEKIMREFCAAFMRFLYSRADKNVESLSRKASLILARISTTSFISNCAVLSNL